MIVIFLPAILIAQVNFARHVIDSTTIVWPYNVFAIDLDQDNDIDVLAACANSDEISWWENDGGQNFAKHTISDSFDFANSVYAADIEPDGDIDVFCTAQTADDVAWFENDGNENFTTHIIAADNFNNAQSVFAIDINGDNDVDVMAASFEDDNITWWENDGNENFTPHILETGYDPGGRMTGVKTLSNTRSLVLSVRSLLMQLIWNQMAIMMFLSLRIFLEIFAGMKMTVVRISHLTLSTAHSVVFGVSMPQILIMTMMLT
jgi:hypothetical protein